MGRSTVPESPSSPTQPSQCWERLSMARPPIPVLQGVLALDLCREELLLPSPLAASLLLPLQRKVGQARGAP